MWEVSSLAVGTNDIIWGCETNHIKVGLYISQSPAPSNIDVICVPYLNSSMPTNGKADAGHLKVWLPPAKSCCHLKLLDETGTEVPKTEAVKMLGMTISEPLMVRIGGINYRGGYTGRTLISGIPEQLPSITLQKFFDIRKTGTYRLEFGMRIIRLKAGNGHDPTLYTTNIPLQELPPVNAKIVISNPGIEGSPHKEVNP